MNKDGALVLLLSVNRFGWAIEALNLHPSLTTPSSSGKTISSRDEFPSSTSHHTSTPSALQHPRKMPGFLSLPAELRELIYGHVWDLKLFVVLEHRGSQHISGPRMEQATNYPPTSDLFGSGISVKTIGNSSFRNWIPTVNHQIHFDATAFLRDHPRQEDEGRYNLECITRHLLSLLFVNRLVHEESWPIFWSKVIFVFGAPGLDTMHFLNSLPEEALSRITSIGLTGRSLYCDGKSCSPFNSCSEIYNPHRENSLYCDPIYCERGMELVFPLPAYLATKTPALEEVYYAVQTFDSSDPSECAYNVSDAPLDLGLLLVHGRIKRLCHVFVGGFAKRTLGEDRLSDSEMCYGALMFETASEYSLELHCFGQKVPKPFFRFGRNEAVYREWRDARREYAGENEWTFNWEWASRDIDIGSDGTIQAVVACTM